MVWKIKYDRRVLKDLQKLDKTVQRNLLDYFDEWIATAANPRRFGNPRKSAFSGLWRYLQSHTDRIGFTTQHLADFSVTEALQVHQQDRSIDLIERPQKLFKQMQRVSRITCGRHLIWSFDGNLRGGAPAFETDRSVECDSIEPGIDIRSPGKTTAATP